MDFTTLVGLIVGVGAILLGNALESGTIGSLVQLTAGLIVFGGTIGATLVSHTTEDLKTAIRLLKKCLQKDDGQQANKCAREIVEMARLARKESILAIESRIPTFSNPYMKNVFRFMIDGADPQTLRNIFEPEMEAEEHRLMAGAKVWSDAGGYAPTIGIIGAVLGLIHVMSNLTNTAELGKGIAIAFVATIYGIGAANLFLLPMANKIKRRISLETEQKKMILDGAVSILSGYNPYIIEEKMRGYAEPGPKVVAVNP